MLNLKNKIVTTDMSAQGTLGRFVKMKNLMDSKLANYLQLTATKNAVNRTADWHYLNLCVTNSTAPVGDLDYVHPIVAPAVDYVTAVVSKGLAPNGEIDFEFVADTEEDVTAARQATDMVSRVLNHQNKPHRFLHEWIQDACLHKNGMLMIHPHRQEVTKYETINGTLDQLKAFELQAAEGGVTAIRQSRRKANVDIQRVMAETQQQVQGINQQYSQQQIQDHIESLKANVDGEEGPESMATPENMVSDQHQALTDSIARNTIYEAEYKLVAQELKIQLRHISQHYWVCDPNVTTIKEQPFCGCYESMTIQQATEIYPDLDIEEFKMHASFNQNAAFQSGSVLNNLAIHARDSAPMAGIPVNSGSAADPYSSQVTVASVWDRYDIDGDGELELIEIVYSGNYIISAKEVEFIPVANMNPKPLVGDFFGYSIAERVAPMQEYATGAHRAEISVAYQSATPKIGVKPDRIDLQSMQDGEASIVLLDSKFDPATDVYPIPIPSGNIQFVEAAMERLQQNVMAMIGMTQPTDVFNPEVMAPGNSGIKLQMALTPNQIIQDDTVKNCAEGLQDAIWLIWRTLIQYKDDFSVKKLAQMYHPERKPVFLDAQAFEDFNFCERERIHISLALGMMSEENSINRQQIIKTCQMEFYQKIEAMATAGTLTPAMAKKIRKPYDDTLYAVGVKDAEQYLPTDEEIMQMIQQGQKAVANKQPTPDDQQKLSVVKLNDAKAQQIAAEVAGLDAESQLEWMSMAMGDPKVYNK